MDEFDQFERSLAAALRSDADLSVARFDPQTIARGAVAGSQPRSMRVPWKFTIMPSTPRWPVAAAAVIGVLAVAGTLVLIRSSQPMVAAPSPTPSAHPSPSLPAVVAPSSTPDATAPNPSAVASSAGVWVATGSMGTPRSGHTAVRLLDGRVLVVGGADGDATSAELYDPDSGTWSATGSMIKTWSGGEFAATLLRDGRVLVGDVEGAEVYDPEDGTWTVTGKMALIDDGARSAAAMAREPTEVAVIDKTTFHALIREEPEFALSIMRLLTERIRRLGRARR